MRPRFSRSCAPPSPMALVGTGRNRLCPPPIASRTARTTLPLGPSSPLTTVAMYAIGGRHHYRRSVADLAALGSGWCRCGRSTMGQGSGSHRVGCVVIQHATAKDSLLLRVMLPFKSVLDKFLGDRRCPHDDGTVAPFQPATYNHKLLSHVD